MVTTTEPMNHIRIIVIDDNEDWCNTVRLLFKMVRAITVTETVAAGSIQDSIEKIREAKAQEKPFSVAIIDMQLDQDNEEDQSGKDIIRFIKREHPYIACVIATGQPLAPEDVLDLRDDHDLDYCLAKDNVSVETLTKSTIKGLKRVRSKGIALPVTHSNSEAISQPNPSQSQQAIVPPKQRIPKVFISYSHRDEEFKNGLVSTLFVLQSQGIIDTWQDREIRPGDEWNKAIRDALEQCQMALLLVSPEFLTSRFIQDQELPVLFQRRRKEGLRAIPIIVRSCMWQEVPILQDLQALPQDGRPINNFRDRDRVWNEIGKEIKRLASEITR